MLMMLAGRRISALPNPTSNKYIYSGAFAFMFGQKKVNPPDLTASRNGFFGRSSISCLMESAICTVSITCPRQIPCHIFCHGNQTPLCIYFQHSIFPQNRPCTVFHVFQANIPPRTILFWQHIGGESSISIPH